MLSPSRYQYLHFPPKIPVFEFWPHTCPNNVRTPHSSCWSHWGDSTAPRRRVRSVSLALSLNRANLPSDWEPLTERARSMKKFLAFFLLAVTSVFAYGQAISVNGGSIQGTITDSSGAAVPGATVVIATPDTGYSHSLKSDSAGFYEVGPLNPGSYTITVSASGFKQYQEKTVVRTGTRRPAASSSLS